MPEKVVTQKLTLEVSDGTRMDAYAARPETRKPCPGVLVLQEAFGVNAHIRDVTQRFAGEGYVAIAPELFHRTAPRFEGNYNDMQSVVPHLRALTPTTAEADLHAAFEWLTSQPDVNKHEVCSVGFCMGGRISYIANSFLPLKAAASFYGGGIAPDLLSRASQLHGSMLFVWGLLDRHIGAEQRRSVIDAVQSSGKVFVNVEFSNADHGFFCDERASYQPQAARQSWALLLEFLKSNSR